MAPFLSMRKQKYILQARDYKIELGRKTAVMGIINMTPDSFSRDGLAGSLRRAKNQALRMVRDGADILDIGGESSRPGARPVSVDEERQRVIPLVKALAAKMCVPISVDTYKPAIAREALDAGASIINTIKGLSPDKALLRAVRDYQAAIVLMHMPGTPRVMQKMTSYKDVVRDVKKGLERSVKTCLEAGISRRQIVIDPGIGFGKTLEQNLQLLAGLSEFAGLGVPLLVGVSRKSLIGHLLDVPVDQRLTGSLAAACVSVGRGADIVRVHDVSETVQALRIVDAIENSRG